MAIAQLRIEVFSSPGCAKCAHAKKLLKSLADELGGSRIDWREVDILVEIDHAVAMGVMSAPAIAIDGAVVFSSLPSAGKLRAELLRRLQAAENGND